MSARHCGRCHACCIHLQVESRPAGKRCGWLDGNGRCEHYEERPDVCREFVCAWKAGLIGEQWRPDSCGFIVQIVKNELGGIGVNVTEFDQGAIGKMKRYAPDLMLDLKTWPCRMLLTTYADGNVSMWSKDKTWIDDLRARNPALQLPPDAHVVELAGQKGDPDA